MKFTYFFPIIGVALILNGCSLMPKYIRPNPPVPDVFPEGEAYKDRPAPAEALQVKGLEWETVFPDKKLQQVIRLALLNSRDLRLAVLNVERARALYGVQKAEVYPSLSASGRGSKQHLPADLSSTGAQADVEQYSVDVGIVTWEIDLFGRLRSLKEQALQEYLSTEQARRGASTALISEVARVYLTLAADLEKLKLAEATLEAQRSQYEMVWHQYDKGITAEPDLSRARTQVDTARAEILRYVQSVAQDQHALNLVVGCTVPEGMLPVDLSSVNAIGDIAPGMSSEVLLRRPDILAAEHQLKAAYAFIGAARAAFFPQISLTTVIGTASRELSGLFDSGSKAWSFTPQAAVPIFDIRTNAAYRVSKVTLDMALVLYEKAIQTAFREVADTLAVRETIDEQVAVQESIVASARKIHELSNQRYIQGLDSYLNVLDAQRSLYAAQQGFTSLRLIKVLNQVRLYAVIGGDEEPSL